MTAPGPAGPRPGGAMGHGAAVAMPVTRSMDFTGSLRRLVGVLRPERLVLAGVVALTVAAVTLAVLGPRMLGRATDLVFAGVLGRDLPASLTREEAVAGLRADGQDRMADMVAAAEVVPGQGIDVPALRGVLLMVAAIYLGAWLFGWVQGRLTTTAVQRTVFRLRQDVETKLGRLSLADVDSRPRGDLLSRVTNDIDNLAQTLQQTLSQLVTAVLTIVGVLAMMVWISPVLALIALVTVPVAALVTQVIARRSRPQFVEQWSRTGTLNAHVEEMYTGHALVKVFGRQEAASRAFHAENAELYRASFRAQFISGVIQPAMMFVSNLGFVAVAVVGGLRVASGTLTLGEVQAFIQYSRQFTQPITQVAAMINLLQSGVASAERVFELLDAPEQSPEPTTEPHGPLRGRVAFEDVSFRYSEDTPLIDHLDLVAEPGTTVAIVGPTGAGKTTLVNLLLRFYEVRSGRITLDGVDIATMHRHDLRRRVAMVLQDTWLFGGTIAENIAYGRVGATREEVVEAARAAEVDRFVRSLPDGYDTVIDEEGDNVSVGEKQLITIARAFLADPTILVLDEATSSVDTRTEVQVQQAMASLRTGRTAFVIAHRLSTIRDADLILVLDRGRIVEQGTHAELVAAGGAYAALHASQFAEAPAPLD